MSLTAAVVLLGEPLGRPRLPFVPTLLFSRSLFPAPMGLSARWSSSVKRVDHRLNGGGRSVIGSSEVILCLGSSGFVAGGLGTDARGGGSQLGTGSGAVVGG